MNSENKHSQPFAIVLSVTIILVIASQFTIPLNWMGYEIKKMNPFSDIVSKGKTKKVPLTAKVITSAVVSKDSSLIAVREADSTNIYDFGREGVSSLAHFFQALNKVKKQKSKVRIAYFGDSMIEGDLISQDLRSSMQDAFGGHGVGFVPVTSIVAGFRKSIIHSFGNWTTYNLLDTVPFHHNLGISGYSFIPQTVNDFFDVSATDSWVKYTSVKQKHLDKFYKTKLLYGKSDGENYVLINNVTYKLDGIKAVNQLTLNSKSAYSTVHASFRCKTSLDVFGFSMESDTGAFVDNFSFRGNSGLPISKIKQSIYSGTNDCLNYDLIILEYGLNAVNSKVTDYSWYERGMQRVIKHLKESFPGVSILLISVGDKGYRVNEGAYETDPAVPLFVDVQMRMAEENNLAFWSLYNAMGGSGSMVKWVEGDTVLANKDYTHFNFRGAHKVGKLLFNKLMTEYNDYNKKQNKL
ncbi:MAG TPA: hypothetical protein VFF27_15530 [Bacteroidia bacterium]|jgi:hypothetical protein|nr:hypothetical protein [Bacteroidia bacterium]